MTDLFDYAHQRFDGGTFNKKRDGSRLQIQLERVRSVLLEGGWFTLAEVSERLDGAPMPSVSARIRDLRKFKFGGYDVQRRYRQRGVWEYRINSGVA